MIHYLKGLRNSQDYRKNSYNLGQEQTTQGRNKSRREGLLSCKLRLGLSCRGHGYIALWLAEKFCRVLVKLAMNHPLGFGWGTGQVMGSCWGSVLSRKLAGALENFLVTTWNGAMEFTATGCPMCCRNKERGNSPGSRKTRHLLWCACSTTVTEVHNVPLGRGYTARGSTSSITRGTMRGVPAAGRL